MNCALRTIVCVFVTLFLTFTHSGTLLAKSEKDHATAASDENVSRSSNEFRWNEHNKLSWSDFRGAVNAPSEESAAGTHCGIGFSTVRNADGSTGVVVYNTFYANRSWVRPDAKKASILVHEQGHFDLCELYTRKLRERMNNFNFNVPDVQAALISIYNEVKNEYETRQQAYELETTHGTRINVQQKWTTDISKELTAGS